jgi:ribosomal protein S27AE
MLTTCLYCSNQISARATVCPKCKADTPLGLECVFCRQRGRRDQVIPLQGSIYSHEACLEHYFSIPEGFTCSDCHTALAGKIDPRSLLGKTRPICPQCGNPTLFATSNPGGICGDCGLPIYDALGHKAVMIREGTGDSLHSCGTPDVYGHSFCRSALSLPKQTQLSRAQTIGLCVSIPLAVLLGLAVWPVAPYGLRLILVLLAIPLVVVLVIAIILGLCWVSDKFSN